MKECRVIWLIPGMLLFLNTCSERIEIPPPDHPQSEKWINLFSNDLSNALYVEGSWRMVNGNLEPEGDSEIFTNVSYDNFILDLEFMTGKGASGGIIVYCSHIDGWEPNSLKVQITDDPVGRELSPESDWCGAIFGHMAPSKSMVKEPGQWNRLTITCLGHGIFVLLNEEPVVELDMRMYKSSRTNPDGSTIPPRLTIPLAELPTMGHIGFQGIYDAKQIRFRNIKIQELD